MAAIETTGLAKDYRVGFWRPRPYRALHGLTLTVESGELTPSMKVKRNVVEGNYSGLIDKMYA